MAIHTEIGYGWPNLLSPLPGVISGGGLAFSDAQHIFHSLRGLLLRRGSDMGIGIQGESGGEVA